MTPGQRSDGKVRLTLFATRDASVLCEADHDPEHRRWFDFPDDFVPSLRHSEKVIARWERERLAGKRFPFAVRDAVTGVLLGGCELTPDADEGANLSYWTYPAHRLHGVASRSVALARAVAFEEMGIRRLEIVTHPDNIGSRRVAARNGFRELGMRDGQLLHVLEIDGRINR